MRTVHDHGYVGRIGDRPRVVHVALVGDPHDDNIRPLVRLALMAAGVSVDVEADAATSLVTTVQPPDLVVLATSEPTSVAADIRSLASATDARPVVVITSSLRLADFAHAIAAGARGYLVEGAKPGRLARAISCAAAGETVVSRRVVAAITAEIRADGDPGLLVAESPLTRRERQVLTLLRQGASTKEIAEQLAIAPVTVRRHIGSVVRKLHVSDRTAARTAALDVTSKPSRSDTVRSRI